MNGQTRRLKPGVRLAELVERLTGRRDPGGVAIAVNREVVPRDQWEQLAVQDGDQIEIIEPFQGG